MIKDFAKRIDYDIPQELQGIVIGIIKGSTEEPIQLFNHPIFATGFPLLVYSYGTNPEFKISDTDLIPKSDLNIAGQIYKDNVTFNLNGILGMIGVILHPLALYYLFHNPGKKYLNTWHSLEDESPIDCLELFHKLSQTNNTNERITLLLDYLKLLKNEAKKPVAWLDQGIMKIFETNGNIDLSILAEQSKVSLRHFRRVFKDLVGMPPKYYCKVIQINTVFEYLNSSDSDKLHHLALDCGYYDQSHFIKDFVKFIGTSPMSFLNSKHAYVGSYLGRHHNLEN